MNFDISGIGSKWLKLTTVKDKEERVHRKFLEHLKGQDFLAHAV